MQNILKMNEIKSLNWVITNRCNSRCTHCDIWQTDVKELSFEEITNFLNSDFIKESYDKYGKDFDVSIGGGEPFLRQDLNNIVELLESKYPGCLKTISTNGLLTKEILVFLKHFQNLKFKLNISIDGILGVHDKIRGFDGAFKKTMNTIRLIRKLFPCREIEITLTLIPANYNQIKKVFLLADKFGCDFSFKPAENMKNYTNKIKDIDLHFTEDQICIIRNQCFELSDIMYAKGNYKKTKFFQDIPFYLTNKKKPSSCSVFGNNLSLMSNGDYYYCIKEEKVGNIFSGFIDSMKTSQKVCESCMLKCGSYKDYVDDFFERNIANFEITLKCNLNCSMCTQKELRNGKNEDMSFSNFKKRIDRYFKISHVSFVGGESFFNEYFFEMMNYLDSKGITYEITTNGTLMDVDIVDRLKKCIGLKKINFSLDGLKEYHDKERGKGVFEKCVNALKITKELFNISVCTIIKEDNLDEIPRFTKFLIGLGIKNQKIIYGMNLSKRMREKSSKIIPQIKISGPILNNQIKIYNHIINLFDNLDEIQNKYSIIIEYEPKIIRKKLRAFLEDKLIYDNLTSCKQLNQLRFNNKGERIICEFIRNIYTPTLADKLDKKLLPICSNCCKLWNKSEGVKIDSISLMIEPTNKCNLRCPTCFSHQDGREKKEMSFDEFKKIIDNNFSLIKNISLYNYGEPLLNKDICNMIKYAKEKGIKFIKLATNGMKLNNNMAIDLLKSNLDYLSISLDGATKETYLKFRIGGDFDLIINNIKNLVNLRNKLKLNMKIEIQFIIMKHNEHEVEDIEILGRKLGVDILRLKHVLIKDSKWNFLLPINPDYNRYSTNFKSNKFNICSKSQSELVINSNGTIIPCCYIVDKDIDKFRLGNIFNESLKNILSSNKYKVFLKNCLNEKNNNSCCLNCNEVNLDLDYKVIDFKKKYDYHFLIKNSNYLKIKNYLKKNINKSKKNFVLDFTNLHSSEIGFTNMVPFLYKLKSFEKSNQFVFKKMDKKYFEIENLPLPNKLEIEPTNRCNLKCPYCSRTFKNTHYQKDMSFKEFKKIIDNYKKAPEIDFMGLGEPLLNKDIFKMITYAKNKGSENCTMSTNCYFISSKNIPLFFNSRLDKLILSIDGASEKTYLSHRKNSNFKKIIKNVYNLCKYKKSKNQTKPKIVLQFIITAYNEHEVGKISILAKKLGVDNISFKTISVTEKTKHFLPKNNLYTRYIKNKEKSVWCPALWDKMAIFSDGQATLCCKAFDVKEKINIGNVFEKNLDSIWNGEKYKKYRQLMLLANKDLIGCNSTCPSGQNPFLK